MNDEYKRCVRCIMDTSDPDIKFNELGICNHCDYYDSHLSLRSFNEVEGKEKLESLLSEIKSKGKNKDYDCIIGVSGGVDSTYVAYLCKKYKLKPLAIHFDNGWNSELAVSNIEKTLKNLDIDLFTYVIDWEEFRNLQLSFLWASTPDGEIPTDHAINALLFKEASKRGIKYIINGMNFKTEASFETPKWAYGHADWRYIKSVQKRFGKIKLKKYPHYTLFDTFYYLLVKRIKLVSILNYIDYDKNLAMKILEDKLGWVYYGGKHYESVYTRFYQSYILPQKFNVDKRLIHLSSSILSGSISRDDALNEMKNEIIDNQLLNRDKEFAMKKLKLDSEQFEQIMRLPIKYYTDYPNNKRIVSFLKKIHLLLRKYGLFSK